MAQSHWEADKMLDVYIYDYLVKRNLQASAKAFLAEGKVSSDPVAIDAPGGFLFEWWSVFWDIFIARTNEKHSELAASYIETQQIKASEHQTLQQQLLQQQQQQHQHQQKQQQQQLQLHLQQFQLMQRQAQPQQQQQPRSSLNGLGATADTLITSPTANANAIKIYEEGLKPPLPQPHQRDSLDRFGDTVVPSQAAFLKASPAASSTPMIGGPMAHGPQGGSVILQQPPHMRPASSQDNKSDVSAALHRSPGPEPSVFNVPAGSANHVKPNLLNPGNNSMTSKSWSLSGMDQLRPGLLTNQKPGLQPYTVLGPQHQQQLQAQGSLPTSGLSDMDPRKMRLLFNRGLKDGQAASLNDTSVSLLPRNPQDPAELLLKMKMAQMQPQQATQAVQPQPSSQGLPLASAQQHQQQVTTSADIPPSHSCRPGDQVYGTMDPSPSTTNGTGTGKASLTKSSSLNGRKRKQQSSSSGPANSGPSPNSPSSPSTHTPGAVMAPTTSKSLVMYGSEEAAAAGLASPSSTQQLADLERFAEDNVDSFLSPDTDADHRDTNMFGRSKASPAGQSKPGTAFQFNEVTTLRASTSKVVCCHFSSNGKLLASAGHDKKVVLWDMDSYKLKCTLEEHSFLITDIRFSLNSTRLATSSFDKTVRVWDADNPAYSLRTFTGHQSSVMSLDFHPVSEDLLCSCDGDNEIRYWSVSQGVCSRVFKGGMAQTRFQPRVGRLLAAAAENVVSIFDVETEMCVHSLQRHTKPVHSVCWDATGDYVASVSEDSVRVWSLDDGECVHELSCNGNKFHSCTFHPTYSRILVIGCYQSLELWDMTANKSMTVPAHDGLIAALAQSPQTGMVASASHDKCVKLWRS